MKKENTKFDTILGGILRSYRENCNMSMRNLAGKLGVTQSNIYYYEHGKTALSVTQLIKICNLYNVDYVTVLQQAQIEMGKSQ